MSKQFAMSARAHHLIGVALVLSATTAAACKPRVIDFGPDGGLPPPEQCPASADWVPVTPPAALDTPAPHPESECRFFQDSFQQFLIATQPDGTGEPALASYATIDDAFTRAQPLPSGALAPRGTHRGTATRAWLGNVAANGLPSIAIDQDGHTLYYGTHLNQAFVDFVNANGLQTARAVQGADPNLALVPGIVELKSAWKDIDPADGVAGDFSTFITTTAWVPHLSKSASGELVEDRNHPRAIRVALIALHVSFTLPGHPELISATFEHAGADGNADTAPSASSNPADADPTNLRVAGSPSGTGLLLFRAGTPFSQANTAIAAPNLRLDEAAQSIAGQTSIYRMFPASKSVRIDPDDQVASLNQDVGALFARRSAALAPNDKRGHYRLVGALWMDKPRYFTLDQSLQNDYQSPFVLGPHINQDGQTEQAIPLDAFAAAILQDGSDSPFSILGGHDRLSSTAVESFTQAPGSYDNCFACHNTKAVSVLGVPLEHASDPRVQLLGPGLLNVSRVFFQLVREECYSPANVVVDGSGTMIAVCP